MNRRITFSTSFSDGPITIVVGDDFMDTWQSIPAITDRNGNVSEYDAHVFVDSIVGYPSIDEISVFVYPVKYGISDVNFANSKCVIVECDAPEIRHKSIGNNQHWIVY